MKSFPWAEWGLPVPTPEYRFHPTRRWRFDWAWEPQHVALEVQGGLFVRGKHSRGAGMLKDFEKKNAGQLLGWAVLECSPQQLKSGEIVPTIMGALRARGWRS